MIGACVRGARGQRVDRRSGGRSACRSDVLENVVSKAAAPRDRFDRKRPSVRDLRRLRGVPAITGSSSRNTKASSRGSRRSTRALIRRRAGPPRRGPGGGAKVDDIVPLFDEGGALKVTPDERYEALPRASRRNRACST